MSSIEVEGLNQTVRMLGRIEPEYKAQLKSINRDLAEIVVPVAKSEARRRSGTMANTIRAGANQRSGIVRAGQKALPYTPVQHFGWPRHNISPNPFLYDALDARRDEVIDKYTDAMIEILNEVASGT